MSPKKAASRRGQIKLRPKQAHAKADKGKKTTDTSSSGAPPVSPGYGKRPCTDQEICKYLGELAVWLKWFNQDYKKLRRAVCNVERKAFDPGGGTSTPAGRFCTNGQGGAEPADPQPPPVWT